MSVKIKFNIFNTLFHLFSFLADKTNGWIVFVKPKLLFGSLIVGLGISACSVKDKSNNAPTCYDPIMPVDTTVNVDSVIENSDNVAAAFPETIETVITVCYVYVPEIESIEEDSMEVYSFVEQMPEFPGGDKAVREFIAKNIKYPRVSCYEGGIEGKVYCRFIIEKDGTVSNVTIIRSLDPMVDKEAVRVIESMPQWIPGKQNGKPVRVSYVVPVVFKMH
jgi:TonB family protein